LLRLSSPLSIWSAGLSITFNMKVLTPESSLCNPELSRPKFINMFTKLCLKSVCNVESIGSLVPEKSDDHSLIMLYAERPLNRL
jgi:hypothetical protein